MGNSAGITSLPDSVLLNIASLADPPSMFNLIQTCSDFHRPSSELSSRHLLSPPRTASQVGASISTTKIDAVKNVAARLVKESLVRGLVSVFQRSNAHVSLEQAMELAKLQNSERKKGRSVLLSGSSLVQTVTGKRFDNFDLDIYCTKESLPRIRGLLVRKFGMVCQGAMPTYGDEEDILKTTSSIRHVETYLLPNESTNTLSITGVRRRYYRAKMAQLAAAEGDADNLHDAHVDMSYLNKRNECLYKIQRYSKYKFPRDFPITVSPTGNGPKAIDIVVCKSSPEETIAQFDIEICKCTFDGTNFQIISPEAFHLRTTASKFTKLGNQYMSYYLQPVPTGLAGQYFISRMRSRDLTNNMMMHIIKCFMKAAANDNCNLPLLEEENALMLNENISWKITPMYFLKLHIQIVTQLERIIKYLKRGIDVQINDAIKARFLPELYPQIDVARATKRRKRKV